MPPFPVIGRLTVTRRHGSTAAMQGGIIPGSGAAAFRVVNADSADLPVLLAAPHGGRSYPDRVLAAMRDPGYTTKRLEDRYIDMVAERVADVTGATLIVADAPRAMIDLNRAETDIDRGMVRGSVQPHTAANRHGHRAHSGLGLVPRRLQTLGEIWRRPFESAEIEACLDAIHRPYHRLIENRLSAIRERWGAVLLLDLHSMPPLRTAGRWQPARFVIGDRFGTSSDAAIPAAAFAFFARHGVQVAHNRPYAGGYVLDRHGDPARGRHAIQLEVDRSLYLDADLDALADSADPLVERLCGLVRALAATVAELANRRGSDREAAE